MDTSTSNLTVKEVYNFLKTKCPNHIVAFGFTTPYVMGLDQVGSRNTTLFDMAERITVSTMMGNLSHAIRENLGETFMTWPTRLNNTRTEIECVTIDTLEEMGMKSNE